MKTFIFVAILLSLGLAQDAEQPRYACPEIDMGFYGNDITMVQTSSWEDCGTMCGLTNGCLFWQWGSESSNHPLECWLKTSDAGLEKADGWIAGDTGCPLE